MKIVFNSLISFDLLAHSLLQPYSDDEDMTLAAGSRGAGSRVRPLELQEVQRDVRARSSLLSESNLCELMDKLNGREQLPGHVRKHIAVCVDNLTMKVN